MEAYPVEKFKEALIKITKDQLLYPRDHVFIMKKLYDDVRAYYEAEIKRLNELVNGLTADKYLAEMMRLRLAVEKLLEVK